MIDNRISDGKVNLFEKHIVANRGWVIALWIRWEHLCITYGSHHISQGSSQLPERLDSTLSSFYIPGIHQKTKQDKLSMSLWRQERHRWRRHHVGDCRKLLRS